MEKVKNQCDIIHITPALRWHSQMPRETFSGQRFLPAGKEHVGERPAPPAVRDAGKRPLRSAQLQL